MPGRNKPKSLKQCSLRRIALSFELFYMKDFNEQFKDVPRLMYVSGPFDYMTNETIQGIINSLRDEQCLRRNHLTVLLQESITDINLCDAGNAVNHDSVLQVIAWRCPRLVRLNLSGMRNMSPRALSDLFRQTSRLERLNLSVTSCNDQVLSVLGHNCPDLVELHVSGTGVGNAGMFSLCMASQSGVGCKKLRRLNIQNTTVNSTGALHCLQNLPLLHYLSSAQICNVIEKDIAQKEQNGLEIQPYDLQRLEVNGIHPVQPSAIVLACKWCPNVREVDFTDGLDDNNVEALKHLKHLTNLCIGNSGTLSFHHGVLPVLKCIGNQLSDLILADVSGTELMSIGQHCQKLHDLAVYFPDDLAENEPAYATLSHSERLTLFKTVAKVELVFPFENTSHQQHAVVTLLKNARHLTHITLFYMSSLSDEILLEVFKENPLLELYDFELSKCNNISAMGIMPLLQSENNLSYLELKRCNNITKADFKSFEKYSRDQKFKLRIKWE